MNMHADEIKTVLVTGGAGYVGSAVTGMLLQQGFDAVVLDNLQQGHLEALNRGAKFILGDISDLKALDSVFRSYNIDAVMHMAGETVVEYSMTDPRRYFHNNIIGGVNLLDTMLRYKVKRIVFSSSAATYGEPKSIPITEDHPQKPINSYGETKLMLERMLYWYGSAYGFKHVSFRYFNAAGATDYAGEDHKPESHLIPKVLAAATKNNGPLSVFGTDYPTRDGSCIRDYVHIADIARAHILALIKIEKSSGQVYNLGNGTGYSVLEVISATEKVTGRKVPCKMMPRREGDPAILLACAEKARIELGLEPNVPDLEDIIRSAWEWTTMHPEGYGE